MLAFDGYFADPFVWLQDGRWYAVGTGGAEAAGGARLDGGLVIPALVSDDLRTWRAAGHVLEPPPGFERAEFWAPAVAVAEGRTWLYYSTARPGEHHHLRVAVADAPLGPYRDLGVELVDRQRCPFSIDAEPVRDADGAWYLFYAVDVLDREDGAEAGTGIVVDRMLAMDRLAGEPRVVVRPRHPWQRFQAGRTRYGRVWDWHTVEGPAVARRQDRWWCLYSGGCWDSPGYGVDAVSAPHPLGPWTSDGGEAEGPRILPGTTGLIGPGHNSLVVGVDGADRIAFHAWSEDRSRRRFHLAPLDWTGAGPRLRR